MTTEPKTKKELEKKITELYVRLHRRQTSKISRKNNLKMRLEAYKNQLQQIHDQESTSSNSDLLPLSSSGLSLDSEK